jgi:hypothetical protein
MGASPPADKFAEIADRLVTQTEEQVIRLGRRSDHWTEADVDWVVAGSTGPRPDEAPTEATADVPGPQPESPASAGDHQAAGDVGGPAPTGAHDGPQRDPHWIKDHFDLDETTVDDGPAEQLEVVHPSPAPEAPQHPVAAASVDDRDLLARGLAHPDPKVRAAAERAAIAVDQLITALTRRPS